MGTMVVVGSDCRTCSTALLFRLISARRAQCSWLGPIRPFPYTHRRGSSLSLCSTGGLLCGTDRERRRHGRNATGEGTGRRRPGGNPKGTTDTVVESKKAAVGQAVEQP